MILFPRSVPGHNSLVSFLDGVLGWVESVDARADIVTDSIIACNRLLLTMIGIPRSIEVRCLRVISEQHVLRVIVDQVALLIRELELSDKTGNSELLNDLKDVKLGVESRTGLALQLVLIVVRVPAAETPWTGEVLLAEEAPHAVAEGLTTVADLSAQVVLELLLLFGGLRVVIAIFMLGLLNIVVKFLGHGVIEGEALVGAEDVADETQAEGKVRTEALECIRDCLANGLSLNCNCVLLELHGEEGVLGVHSGGSRGSRLLSI